MSNRYFSFSFVLVMGLPLAAQAQQPFEQFGIKVKILSLSNGRYPEFFPNDSLRRIGTVVYNTRLKRVAHLLPADSLVGRVKSEITSRWWAVDPLAEKYAHISPYVFVNNNALRFNDPDGREGKDVILKGPQAKAALQQLQASVQGQLNLAMDNKTGKVTYTPTAGATQSKGATQLAAAIDDHNVTVNVTATNSKAVVFRTLDSKGNAIYNRKLNVGGAFLGNTVIRQPNDAPNKVETQQLINIPAITAMDDYLGKPGSSTLHEVVESYLGGKMSQQTGISSKPGGEFPSFYQNAHSAAPPQSGTITQGITDQSGRPFQGFPGQIRVETYSIEDANHPPKIFLTNP